MKTMAETVTEGRVAQELLRQLEPHLAVLRSNYKDRWAKHSSGVGDREDLYRKMVVLDELESEIKRVVQTGRVAQEIARTEHGK